MTPSKKAARIRSLGSPIWHNSDITGCRRGYIYSVDTELYYLQSRYYNPEIGRFINADALVSTGQGILGNNMFAYCRNNPVCRVDVSGREDVECTDLDANEFTDDEDYIGGGGYNANAGAPVGTNTGNSGTGNSGGGQAPVDQPAPPAPGGGQSNGSGNNGGTPIYRYGGNSPDKLTPTANDVATDTGLSFSTKGRAGAATTTIEEINASGYLYAVQDGKTHVSVYPVGATIAEWYAQGATSPWTQILVQMVTLV